MKKDIITDFVLNNIKEGKYKPGCRIMSEGDMAQRFGVSKITVRAALEELVKKEIIYKKNGAGSFVSTGKKQIILYCQKKHFTEIEAFFTELIKQLSDKIEEKGFIPNIIVQAPNIDFPEINQAEVKGMILIYTYNSHLEKYNVPLIDYDKYHPTNYSVNLDYDNFYMNIYKIIKKEKYKNPIFFKYERKRDEILNYMDIPLMQYFKNTYKGFELPRNLPTFMTLSQKIDECLQSIKTKPDCIMFFDNTLFQAALPIFQKYNDIFKNTKIITHSTNLDIIPSGYNITKFEIDINEISDRIINKMFNLIEGRPVQCNEFLKFKITDV